MAPPVRFALERIEEIDSTSSELMRRARPWLALLARRQTVGRGRLGRPWQSLDGNLNLSVSLDVQQPQCPGHWSLLAAVAMLEALRSVAPERGGYGLKWPNDILLDGRKLGGILLELAPAAPGRAFLVIGFGVNLAVAPSLDRPVASLAETGPAPDPGDVARALLACLEAWVGRYETDGFEPVRLAWLAAGHRPGEAMTVARGDTPLHGRFAGIAPDGALLLHDGARQVSVASGEVGVAAAPAV